MRKKKSEKKNRFKKIFDLYRAVVINEDTFEEKIQLKFSIINIVLIFFVFLIITFVITYFVIAYSPIKEFIPGYPSSEMRRQSINNAIKIDSISLSLLKQQRYLLAIKSALAGEIEIQEIEKVSTETLSPSLILSTKTSKEDSLLREFVAQEDKYNIIHENDDNTLFLLNSPAKGTISEEFSIEDKHFAVDIALNENDPIKAVAGGTVVFSEWTAETGYVIMIEHQYGLLSIYKHNSTLNKQQGDNVEAGEVIAMAGNTGKYSTGFHLHFELWSEGYPLNPVKFIDFSN
ncbi:MAG: peptidase M23 [Flavobacteriaceae bacterium]|nr:peptidase M23 [Flavobacteriaceae bacterium]|tara:strand:- start:25443 stop:26309 length:867 start_codon:yes stop_codon:yes gene_type:complete